jgi:sugar phosphate isomerase/epimerase
MFDIAVSELTSSRWDLQQEIAHVAAHGFESISLWRAKVSDVGAAAAARVMRAAGVRVSSLQWAGGFTGGDGRSFAESVDDAIEAIDTAAILSAPVLVLQSGCRGGHTRTHAARLLGEALETLTPIAARAGVTLALKPVHAAAAGCSFLTGLGEALDLVGRFDDRALRLALDLWHFGDDAQVTALMPRLAAAVAIVHVADRSGSPAVEVDRLPAGHGSLPLERLVYNLVEHGYAGAIEFDPVGEAVEILGYDGVWQETRLVADAWADRHAARREGPLPAPVVAGIDRGRDGDRPSTARGQFRAGAAVGSRRSHASTHTGSPG